MAFSCDYCEISKNSFLYRRTPVAASSISITSVIGTHELMGLLRKKPRLWLIGGDWVNDIDSEYLSFKKRSSIR